MNTPSGRARVQAKAGDRRRVGEVVLVLGAVVLAALGLSCSASESGGMSGTGISQGSINSFGSIFVNGIEWNLNGASIEIDGVRKNEADLRVGMVVRVDGSFNVDGVTGQASRVSFNASLQGPIESAPVETVAGIERTFTVLGTTVIMRTDKTSFDGGATFAGLAANDVIEVSGFVDWAQAIHATRIEKKGTYPGLDSVELHGAVMNLVKNPDGSGIFDVGSITVRYTNTTTFKDTNRTTLVANDLVEVKATIRDADEVDATRIELESAGFGSGDAEDAKVEGIVATCAQSPDYCVSSVPINDDSAVFEPGGYVPAPGDRIEVRGSLVAGVLVATRVKNEDNDSSTQNVRIDGAPTSVNGAARTLVILGVTVSADGNTLLEDKSNLQDENLSFSELQAGQYLLIEAKSTGTSTALALRITREDGQAGNDDVRLEGPVTALDAGNSVMSILGQAVPVDGGTEYRDADGQQRSEDQFFRNPGDVAIGDVVQARDKDAANLSVLGTADEVEIESP